MLSYVPQPVRLSTYCLIITIIIIIASSKQPLETQLQNGKSNFLGRCGVVLRGERSYVSGIFKRLQQSQMVGVDAIFLRLHLSIKEV